MSNPEKLQKWLLSTPSGRYTLTNERIFYHNSVANVFGYYSLQIGLPEINFLQGNKIPSHYVIGQDIQCSLKFLPFENNSIDLIVCPHILEINNNYEHILQECYRILTPHGKLILTCFNSNYYFNWLSKKPKSLRQVKPINLDSLKQQLFSLNFSILGGKFFGYRPLINNADWLSRLSWLDKAGDRWLPALAHNFGLIASKEIITPTRIQPAIPNYNPKLGSSLGAAKVMADTIFTTPDFDKKHNGT